MATYSVKFKGDVSLFESYVQYIRDYILTDSVSASLEESLSFKEHEMSVQIDTIERYSFLGKNRLSLNITSFYHNEMIHTVGISSGASQALFLKLNYVSEESFVELFKSGINEFLDKNDIQYTVL